MHGKNPPIACGALNQSLSRYRAGRGFHGVFVHFAGTKKLHTAGRGTPAQHAKGITENAHTQATTPVYQFTQRKRDVLHPISVLCTGTLCEQKSKSNFGLHKVFIVRLPQDVELFFFGTAGTMPRRYADTDQKVLWCTPALPTQE